MNDGMLSQDEIDALLKVSENEDLESRESMNSELSNIEVDALGEIGNISIGSSATTLSTLLNQKVEITTPSVTIISREDINNGFDFEHVNIQVNYIEGFSGQNILVIKSEDAAIISDIMLGGDGTSPAEELNEIHLSAVQEAMNQMMGAASTSLSTVFNKRVDISPPSIKLASNNEDSSSNHMEEDSMLVKVSFQLKVGTLIDSSIMQIMPINFAKELVSQLLSTSNENVAATIEMTEKPIGMERDHIEKDYHGTDSQSKKMMGDKQPTHDSMHSPQYIGNPIDQENVKVQQAAFSNFNQVELNQKEHRNLDMLLDIPLKVTVELGRTKRTIKDILDLSAGSIIELDKLAGEPVDILVNEKLIAKGEVVVIDENFGVRVTDILSQSDRLMKLK